MDMDLSDEQSWLCDVYGRLISYANELGPIPRAVLTELIQHYLEKVIPVLLERAPQLPPPLS
jgi:hypothetical protein